MHVEKNMIFISKEELNKSVICRDFLSTYHQLNLDDFPLMLNKVGVLLPRYDVILLPDAFKRGIAFDVKAHRNIIVIFTSDLYGEPKVEIHYPTKTLYGKFTKSNNEFDFYNEELLDHCV